MIIPSRSFNFTCRINRTFMVIVGLFFLVACESTVDFCECLDDCLDRSEGVAEKLNSGELTAERVAEKYSDRPDILWGIGQSLWHPRSSRSALVILQQAKTACRQNPIFLNHLADSYWDNFRFEEAIAIFEGLVDSNVVPQGGANDLLVAQYQVMTGQHERAVELLDGILEREAALLGEDISFVDQIGALEKDILLWRGAAECFAGKANKSLELLSAADCCHEHAVALQGVCQLHGKVVDAGSPIDDVRAYFSSCRPLLSLGMISNADDVWEQVNGRSLVCEQERDAGEIEYMLELENQAKLVLAAFLTESPLSTQDQQEPGH